MKLKSKLTISLIFTSFVLLAYTILFEYTNSRDQLILIQKRSLEVVADLKVSAINNYFSKFVDEVVIAQDYLNLRTELPVISRLTDQRNHPDYLRAKQLLDSQLLSWVTKRKSIVDVLLQNEAGEVVYLLNEKHQVELEKKFFDPSGECFSNGRNGVYISDIFRGQDNEFYIFRIFAPIHDLNNNFIGEIIFEVKADELYALIGGAEGLGKTGETFLGRLISDGSVNTAQRCYYNNQGDNVLLISPMRSDPNSLFSQLVRVGGAYGQPIQNAAAGKNGSGISYNNSGQTVLAVWRYLPERHWGLVTEISHDELLLPALKVVESSLIFGPLMFLVLIIIAVRLASTISLPIDKLTNIAKKIGKGDLNVKFDDDLMQSDNEVGILSKTLEKSIVNLRDLYTNLEKKVQERTAQIEEAHARVEAILRSIGEGVIAVDEEGRIIFINNLALDLLHLGRIEAVGKNITDAVIIQDENGRTLASDEGPIIQALRLGKTTVLNIYPKIYYFCRRDKSRFPVALSTTPVKLQNKVIGAIEVFRDITNEHEIDKAKTEFVSLASHQLRSPLTAISWYVEMLLTGDLGKLSKEQKKYLNEIHQRDRNMLALVNALLNVSRLEMGTFMIEPEPTDIIAVARSVIFEMKPEIKKKKIKFTEDFSSSLPKINIDPKLIRIVIQNLLSNAVKYTPPKGNVVIRIKEKKPHVLITVTDTGFGIPQNVRAKIFTKLFRADNVRTRVSEGTGLGLYLVKSIVDFMEGVIWFDSEENKG